MNRKNYKSKRETQPKRNNKVKGTKRRLAAGSKEINIYTQSQLREEYIAKAEWINNVIPKLQEKIP
jgi:hypothetical protein